jgi:hypothetical protein
MTLRAFTARMGSRDPDWLDITLRGNQKRVASGYWRHGHRNMGMVFAPSPQLLQFYLDMRRAGELTPRAWGDYVARYTRLMRESYVAHRPAWDRLLALPRVVLLCFCTDPERCHRTVLARDILPKLGAEYCGEIEKENHGTKY